MKITIKIITFSVILIFAIVFNLRNIYDFMLTNLKLILKILLSSIMKT